jgi:hypothetical protein
MTRRSAIAQGAAGTLVHPFFFESVMKHLIALSILLALPAANANDLPAQAHIVYQARLGGFPVGRAEQLWRIDQRHYTLTTELIPLLGPRIRYVTHGDIDPQGLKPLDYAEFRNDETTPRRLVHFDWPRHEARFGPPEAQEGGSLDAGAQDLNGLPFQLAWQGDNGAGTLQIATGRKLRHDTFSAGAAGTIMLRGKPQATRSWRAADGEDRTEVWLAPALGNLPVKIIRSDEKGELQLVAQSIDTGPEKP